MTDRGWSPSPGEILTVSELLGRARSVAEATFSDVWMEGEVSDLRVPSSGHAYFTLGDHSGRLRAVCFKNTLRLLDFAPAHGAEVLARGRLSVYEPRGDLQFIVEYMSPAGEGLKRLMLEALIKKLRAEGLFDEERKRSLPHMPRAIAVVTSQSGAAVRDILKVLKTRAPWLDVYVCPATVQGERAPGEIIDAIRLAQEVTEVDAIIVGRGGGSGEDLSAFNDEWVVRAVAASRIPVISAVGHEIDWTLTDFAADKRAPTPSAAAEMSVRETSHWLSLLKNAELSMVSSMKETIGVLRRRLSGLDPERYEPTRVIERRRITVDRFMESASEAVSSSLRQKAERLRRIDARLGRVSPELKVLGARSVLNSSSARLDRAMGSAIAAGRKRSEILSEALDKMNPTAVLARGYAVVLDANGKAVTDAASRALGDEVVALLHRGSLTCEVLKADPPD